jgi:hypothetical protein
VDALRHKPTAYTDNAPSFWRGGNNWNESTIVVIALNYLIVITATVGFSMIVSALILRLTQMSPKTPNNSFNLNRHLPEFRKVINKKECNNA